MKENEEGQVNFKSMRSQEQTHSIEQVGKELRSKMSFLNPTNKVSSNKEKVKVER